MRFCLGLLGGAALVSALSAASLDGFAAKAETVVRADRRTGRLVRVVAAPKPAPAPADAARVPGLVEEIARSHGVDPLLVHAVIQTESNYNPFALSPKGAQGLMQLMPATARRFGVRNTFDIQQNLRGGASYLKHLLELFGDRELALAAYNAGEEAVIRHNGIPPYPETREYVRRVAGRYAEARNATRATAPAGVPTAAQPEHPRLEYYFDAQGNLHVATK